MRRAVPGLVLLLVPALALAGPSAATRLVDDVVAQVTRAGTPSGHLDLGVAVSPQAPGAGALATTVRDLLVGRLEALGRWTTVRAAPAAPGAAKAEGIDVLLAIQLGRRGARLTAEGTLGDVDRGPWEAALGRDPPLLAHVYTELPVDAALRAALGPMPTDGGLVAVRVARPRVQAAGATTADLDGDGVAELIVAGTERVAVWRLSGGRFTESHALSLGGLPRSATPVRSPTALVAALPGETPVLLVWTGRRTGPTWVSVGAEGLALAEGPEAPGAPLATSEEGMVLVGEPVAGRVAFRPRGWWSGRADAPLTPVDLPVVAAGVALGPGGAGGVTLDGRLVTAAGAVWRDVGAAAASCDLDADGVLDVIVSAPTDPTAPDRLVVLGEAGEGPRWRSPPLAGPVYALACGDVDGDGLPEAVGLPLGPSEDAWLLEVR